MPHDLIPFAIARDGVAIAVHSSNPVSELTVEQVAKIYSGEITNWSEVGGEDRPIVLLSRESNSGTYVYFLENVIRDAVGVVGLQAHHGYGTAKVANIAVLDQLEELGGKIRGLEDLPDVRVGAYARSESVVFLAENGITAKPYENVRDGLQALVQKEIDAFVFNESVLKYMVKKEFAGVVAVLPGTFDPYYLGMAMPTNSALQEQINRALLRIIAGDEWDKLVVHDMGGRS